METGEAARTKKRRHWALRALRSLTPFAIAAVLLVIVLPQIAEYGDVWRQVRSMKFVDVGILIVFSAWNILTYQFVMMAALPGLSLSQAFHTGQISTAVTNTLPAGSIVGVGVTYAVLASFGHGASAIALAAVLTGWWNALAKFALPSVALLILAFRGGTHVGLLSAALTGLALLLASIVVLVFITTSDRFARLVGRTLAGWYSRLRSLVKKPPVEDWEDRFSSFRQRSAGLLRRRWHVLTVATIVSYLSLFWVLLAALRIFGVPHTVISWPEALAAFAVVTLATAVPITPGSLGVVELGMSFALQRVANAADYSAAIVAAVLLFRALTYFLQVLLGILSYFIWRWQVGRMPANVTEAGTGI
jgi:uncharacterized protein (TIRG00374 family)